MHGFHYLVSKAYTVCLTGDLCRMICILSVTALTGSGLAKSCDDVYSMSYVALLYAMVMVCYGRSTSA